MKKKQCAFVLTVWLLFCLESTAMTFTDSYSVIVNVIFAAGITAVICALLLEEARLLQDQYELKKQIDYFKVQSRNVGEEIEEMKRMRHNVHHHLNVIGILNQEGKQNEITEYLSRYVKVYAKLETKKLSGYMILDSVLRYYLREMEEEQIPVKTHFGIGSSYDFDPTDITALFGNCLENAIEEQRRLPTAERFVDIDIQTDGQMLLICMKNKCVDGIDMKGAFADWKKFSSSKRRGENGEGLRSIDRIARKYSGSARFQKSGGLFVMHVVLRIPQEQFLNER